MKETESTLCMTHSFVSSMSILTSLMEMKHPRHIYCPTSCAVVVMLIELLSSWLLANKLYKTTRADDTDKTA